MWIISGNAPKILSSMFDVSAHSVTIFSDFFFKKKSTIGVVIYLGSFTIISNTSPIPCCVWYLTSETIISKRVGLTRLGVGEKRL